MFDVNVKIIAELKNFLTMPYTLLVQEAPAIPISFVLGSMTMIDQVARDRRHKESQRMVTIKYLVVF
jgi:hypothetical protein